jgi:hypothetical protein
MYRAEIRRELEHLHDLTFQTHVKTAYCCAPSGSYQAVPEEYHIAIESTNGELKQFAGRYQDTTYLGYDWIAEKLSGRHNVRRPLLLSN